MEFELAGLEAEISDDWSEESEPLCIGLFFRAKKNYYLNSRDEYVYQERMTPLKRMSCKGCSQCGYLKDELNEQCCMDEPPIVDDLQHGAVYQLKVTNIQTDWESGYADDWDIEFVFHDKGHAR